MRGRESIRVAFTIRRVALWWLLACCGVGAPTAAAVEDRLVASSTLLVFSGGQDAAAVMAQRDAFAAALRKSGNEQLGSDVAALRHWYLEAGPDDLFPLGVDQAYMATVLGDVIHNVTHTQVVVSFGPAASQCDVLCDTGADDGGAGVVPRTCVDTVVPANTVQRVARALKPAVRTLVLLHDGCAAADRLAEELLAGGAGASSLNTIVKPVRDLQQLSSTLGRYQNDTRALVLLPSYECLDDAASPSAVGELLAASNSLGELVPSELLRHGLLASVEPSAAAVAEMCGMEVGRRVDLGGPATSSAIITSYGSQLWLNWARAEALVDYGIHVQDTVVDERALPILVNDALAAYKGETCNDSAMRERVLVIHSYGADDVATAGQHSGFVDALEQAGAAASSRRTLFWWANDQLSSTHALMERMTLFTAEYIRRFEPHVAFVSGDLVLRYLAHSCVRRIWRENDPGALPAFLPIAGSVTVAPDPESSSSAWARFHPCRGTHFIVSGIQAEPKVTYAGLTTGEVETNRPLYVLNNQTNIAACAAGEKSCVDLYASERPANLTVILERDGIGEELDVIRSLKPNATRLVWIGDQSAVSDARKASMRAYLHSHPSSPLALADADMHQLGSVQAVLDTLAAYQSCPEYFVYVSGLDAVLETAQEEFLGEFLRINTLGERVPTSFMQTQGLGRSLLFGAGASAYAMGGQGGARAALVLRGLRTAGQLSIFAPQVSTTGFTFNVDRALQLRAFGLVQPGADAIHDADAVYRLCAPGFFHDAQRSSCVPCPAGTFKATFGNHRACTSCNVGQSVALVMHSPEGSDSATSCSCPSTHSTRTDPWDHRGPSMPPLCVPCSPGQHIAGGRCVDCPAGSVSTDGAVCRACALGHYQPQAGMTACMRCEPDTFASADGSVSCESCPAHTATNLTGAVHVDQCTCLAGFFSSDVVLVNNTAGELSSVALPGAACRSCVRGGVCEGGVALPYASPSFWAADDSSEHRAFYECLSEHACPGGQYDAQAQAVTARSQCAQGSAGALCSRCQKGYSRTKLGGCSECEFKHGAYLVAPLFVVGVMLLVWWLYACHDAAANANMGRSMNLRFNSAALQLLQFCQTLGLLAQYIAFGEPFHLITDKFGFLVPDYNMLMMDCLVVSSVHMRYVFRMMWPLLVMLALWLLDHGVLARCWKRYKPSAFHEICVRIMNMSYIFIVRDVASVFSCYKQQNEHVGHVWSLREQPDVQCFDWDWATHLLPLATFGFILYGVGFPLYLLSFFNNLKSNMKDRCFREKSALIIRRFDSAVPWWEMVVLLRKLCLSLVVTLASRNEYKIALVIDVLMLSILLQAVYTPYFYQKNNLLELLTLGTTVVLLQLVSITADHDNWSCTSLLCRAVSTTNLLLFVSMLGLAIYMYYEDFADHVYYLCKRQTMEDTRTNALRMEASVAATKLQALWKDNSQNFMVNFITRSSDADRARVITLLNRVECFAVLYRAGFMCDGAQIAELTDFISKEVSSPYYQNCKTFTSRMRIFNIATTQRRRSSTSTSLAEVQEEGSSAVAGEKAQPEEDDVGSPVRQTALDLASPSKRKRVDPSTDAPVELSQSPTVVALTPLCSALLSPTCTLRTRAASPVEDEVHSCWVASSSSGSSQRRVCARPVGLSPPTPFCSVRSLLDDVADHV